jgi:hypothetical protein
MAFGMYSKHVSEYSNQLIPYADEVVPGDGTGLTGLYLEGARWDEEREQLTESLPNTRFSPLPTLLIQPR